MARLLVHVKLEPDDSNIEKNMFFSVFKFFEKVYQQSITPFQSNVLYVCMTTNGKLPKILCINK